MNNKIQNEAIHTLERIEIGKSRVESTKKGNVKGADAMQKMLEEIEFLQIEKKNLTEDLNSFKPKFEFFNVKLAEKDNLIQKLENERKKFEETNYNSISEINDLKRVKN